MWRLYIASYDVMTSSQLAAPRAGRNSHLKALSLSLSLFSTSSNHEEEEGKDIKLKLGVDTVGDNTLGQLIHCCLEFMLGAKRRRKSLEHKGEDIHQW